MWYKSEEIIRYLDRSPSSHFRIMAILTLCYFIELSIFVLSLEKLTIAPLLTLKGLNLIVYTILALGFGFLVASYTSTLAIWASAKCFYGKGSLNQTRAAVLWTLLWTVPIGFFLLLIYFTIKKPDHGLFAVIIRIISYIGVLTTFIYGFIILLKNISEVHSFGLWRAFLSIFLGFSMLVVIGFAIVKFL